MVVQVYKEMGILGPVKVKTKNIDNVGHQGEEGVKEVREQNVNRGVGIETSFVDLIIFPLCF